MLSRSGPTPQFAPYTLVCTAMSRGSSRSMVHRWVAHTTQPVYVTYLLKKADSPAVV